MPAGTPLTADAILSAAEEVIRRHGTVKATVVDVARALGVSHTAVYKHFSSKQALREAVTRRWLDPNRDELAAIATDARIEPSERLRAWLSRLLASKQAKARDDPELFAAYGILATEHSSVAERHIADLQSQLRSIVADGIGDGSFNVSDPAVTARAIFDATTRFHDLAHTAAWCTPEIHADLAAVCTLIIEGLRTAMPAPSARPAPTKRSPAPGGQ